MRYTIKKSNGTKLADVNSIEYQGEWMGERYVSLTIRSAVPLEFSLGDYIEYRDEKFELNVLPSKQKQSTIRTSGEAFVYENIKFNSLTDELVRCRFRDYVEGDDNTISFVGNPSFSFFCADVSDLVKRIKANLNAMYGNNVWTINMAQGFTPTDEQININVSADNINCWEALALINSEFDVKFVIEKTARTITVGTSGKVLNVLEYGKGKGLRKITTQTENNQAIVTRLRAYGNETNMPYHYYYYKTMHCYWGVNNTYHFPNGTTISGVSIAPGYYVEINVGTPMTFLTNYQSITGLYTIGARIYTSSEDISNGETVCTYMNGKILVSVSLATYTSVVAKGKNNVNVEINKYIDKKQIGYAHKYWDYGNPTQLLATKRLMLPGFPENEDPFVDSDNIDELGVREGTITFDGSDEDYDDVYPTIEDMTMKDLSDAGYTTYKATEDASKALDKIELDAFLDKSKAYNYSFSKAEDYATADDLSDDGVYDAYSEIGEVDGDFIIRIRNIGFDLKDADIKLSASEYPVLSVKDGACGGREFSVVNAWISEDSTYYTLLCEKVKDDSLGQYFPNMNAVIKKEDHFVLTNMYMPDVYIDAASSRLQAEAEAWLAANDTTTYKYEVEIDPIYMAMQHDTSLPANSLYLTLKEGDIIWFKDEDFNEEQLIEIEKLTITEEANSIPKYKVSLNNEKTVGTIQRIQNAIKGIQNGTIVVNGGSKGASINQVKDLFNNMIENLDLPNTYVSKQNDDVVHGKIEFEEETTFDDDIIVNTRVKSKEYDHVEIDGVDCQGKMSVLGKSTFLDEVHAYEGVEFDKSTSSTSYIKGLRGCKIYKESTGWVVETDYLSVNKKATFNEVEINKVSHIGGQQILTAASCKADHIYSTSRAYYVLFKKQDNNGNVLTNNWVANDQAYCQTFDATGSTAKCKYYWVLVMETSDKENNSLSSKTEVTCMDGETVKLADYHWIALTKQSSYKDNPTTNESTPCVSDTWSDVPEVGDEIVQLGCRDASKPERQGATLLAGSGKWKQALIMWKKIDSFIMPSPEVKISPSGVNIVADSLKFVASTGVQKDVESEFSNSNGRISNILDDGTIVQDEKIYFEEMKGRITNEYQDVMTQYSAIPSAERPQSLNNAYNTYWDCFDDVNDALVAITNRQNWEIPIKLSNGTSSSSAIYLNITRTQLNTLLSNYAKYLSDFNYALSSYKTDSIGSAAAESAKQEAIEYVEEHIDEILDASTKDMVDGWIEDYTDGKFVETSTYTQDKQGIQMYTTWTKSVMQASSSVGATGFFNYLNTLFVGTSAITFNSNGEVSNISKSGLVTSTEFAALTATLTDSEGNIISESVISTYIQDGIGSAVIKADQVEIQSGSDKTMNDYFSIKNGDLFCQNLTVVGVINNLVDVIDWNNNINKDKIIWEDDSTYSLDVLRLGDVVVIKSLPEADLVVPYYIDSEWNKRTKTMYNDNLHWISPSELNQLIGRKMTLILQTPQTFGGYRLKGTMSPNVVGANFSDVLNNNMTIAYPTASNMTAPILTPKVLHLEFHAGTVWTERNNGLFQGYFWSVNSLEINQSDIEEEWTNNVVEDDELED